MCRLLLTLTRWVCVNGEILWGLSPRRCAAYSLYRPSQMRICRMKVRWTLDCHRVSQLTGPDLGSLQVLHDALSSRKDDSVKAADVQLGQVLHLQAVTEARRLRHHVPASNHQFRKGPTPGHGWTSCPTCCPQMQAASSCGPSPASAAGLEQTSGSEPRCGSGGTWCCRHRCASHLCVQRSTNGPQRYSLDSFVDIRPVPPATSREDLQPRRMSGTTSCLSVLSAVWTRFTYHSNICVSPVAIVTVMDESDGLARQNRQRLFGQKIPGYLHVSLYAWWCLWDGFWQDGSYKYQQVT